MRKGIKLFVFLCVYASSSFLNGSQQLFEEGQQGLKLYNEQNYRESAPRLKKVLEKLMVAGQHNASEGQQDNLFLFANAYVDITRKDLDKSGSHSLKQAVIWYVTCARGDQLPQEVRNCEDKEDKIYSLKQLWNIADAVSNELLGIQYHMQQKWREASRFLKRASKANCPSAQGLYWDICYRQLDKKPHFYREAALWALLAGKGGDPNTLSYLNEIIPNLLDEMDLKKQIQMIVKHWVIQAEIGKLKRISPKKINDYILWNHQDFSITKTTAQKLPYFFEKALKGIMCELGVFSVSPVQDELESQEKVAMKMDPPLLQEESPSLTCKQEVTTIHHIPTLISQQCGVCRYGPIYWHYYENELGSLSVGESLPVPIKEPKIDNVLYKFLLDAFWSFADNLPQERVAMELCDMSHRDYPWLIAAIKAWEKKFNYKPSSLKDTHDVLEQLEKMDYENIEKLRLELEEKDNEIWKSEDTFVKEYLKTIAQEFREDVVKFFEKPVSWKSVVITKTKESLYNAITTLQIDCKTERGLSILKDPFLMGNCHVLELQNVEGTATENALSEGLRYCFRLIKVQYDKEKINLKRKWGKKIQKLFEKMKKWEVEVIEIV